MKQITLAKANKIRNHLESVALHTVTQEIQATHSLSLEGFETAENLEAILAGAETKFFEGVDRLNSLTLTILKLRNMIATANMESGG